MFVRGLHELFQLAEDEPVGPSHLQARHSSLSGLIDEPRRGEAEQVRGFAVGEEYGIGIFSVWRFVAVCEHLRGYIDRCGFRQFFSAVVPGFSVAVPRFADLIPAFSGLFRSFDCRGIPGIPGFWVGDEWPTPKHVVFVHHHMLFFCIIYLDPSLTLVYANFVQLVLTNLRGGRSE